MENLNLFFSKIKNINFIQRLFSWGALKSLSYEAFKEYRDLESSMTDLKEKLETSKNTLIALETEKASLLENKNDTGTNLVIKDNTIGNLEADIKRLNDEISELSSQVAVFESQKEEDEKTYKENIAQLNDVKENLESERTKIHEDKLQEEMDRQEAMKKQWAVHEVEVEQCIKMICQTHLITYVDKVPFKGSPDNTLEICKEYIIFDSKSPANDDLTNFPKYIKDQTDGVKKYAKFEEVKKDIYLVVPTNTIDVIPKRSYNMGDYNVFIITKDALEPVILSLKKIEEYEFAEQLSPEERDNICRVIGRFAHSTKRKIQIDQYFANHFLELLKKCKNELPHEILETVIEFEKAEKLNPPVERRAKQILTKELSDQSSNINKEAEIREVQIPNNFNDVKKLD